MDSGWIIVGIATVQAGRSSGFLRKVVTKMDSVTLIPWRQSLAIVVALLGLLVFWRGLLGEHGLLRRRIVMLERLAGWRLTLVGLTLVGLGAGLFWESRLLLVLSLGIGFVEIQEATQIIRAWRWSDMSKMTHHEERARGSTMDSRPP